MAPLVLPIRITLNDAIHDVGHLVLNDDAGRTTMAFRYSPYWLENGFALGADVPLVEGVIYPRKDDLTADSGVFGFVRDAAPAQTSERLFETAHLNALKSAQIESEIDSTHLWARDNAQKHRFSAYEFPLTHSFNTLFSFDLKQRKNALNFVRLLEGLPNALQKASEAELATLTAGVFPLPGRRPKALVTYGADRATYVLRVRNRTDDYNVPLWTQVTQTLAAACDLTVLPSCYEPIGTDGVHLEPRFDRSGDKRLFCLSARTLCRRDPERHTPLSYLDVADVINAEGVRPKRDLKELFGRMVFDCLTGNVHNRPENIWFYRANGGWNLAPLSAPRVSPTLIRTRLLPIALNGNDTVADTETAILLASYFGLRKSDAKQMVIGMQKTLYRWKDVAVRLGADPIQINRMASSFNQE